MTTISLKLPEPLRQELKVEAERRGVSQSAVIRASLEVTLRSERAKKRRSCLDLMDGLAGGFKGPPDLSTNPKWLEEAILSDHRRERKRRR
jgi:Arc/MetJ-type ribon-helix-helix transcriptional regulator